MILCMQLIDGLFDSLQHNRSIMERLKQSEFPLLVRERMSQELLIDISRGFEQNMYRYGELGLLE